MTETTDRKNSSQIIFLQAKNFYGYSPLNNQILRDTGKSVYGAYQGNGASGNIFFL